MKKIFNDYDPPVFNFLFVQFQKRKDMKHANHLLGGELSFTS